MFTSQKDIFKNWPLDDSFCVYSIWRRNVKDLVINWNYSAVRVGKFQQWHNFFKLIISGELVAQTC